MLHAKDRSQLELPINLTNLNDKKYNILKNTVYHVIRRQIIPKVPINLFKKHFHDSWGRKTKDIQSIIGLFFLQAMFDLSDEQTVESFIFDQKFHYALDLKEDNAYISIRAFYYYKNIIIGKEKKLFDNVLEQIMDKINFDFSLQRTDSSIISLNLKKMSQWELFKTTIVNVLDDIKKNSPINYNYVPEHIQEYLKQHENNTWFTGFTPSKAQDYLVQAARDALTLKDLFEDDHEISTREPFLLLLRLIDEQLSVTEEDIKIEIKKEHKGSAMANPHDPEAQFNGHKKQVGVKCTISETCSQDSETEDPQIITNVDVNQANVSDQEILESTIDQREERGCKPDVELTDNGFESDANHQALKEKDVNLVAPPVGDPPDGYGIIDFELCEEEHIINKCPLGQSCIENRVKEHSQTTTSYFDRDTCKACPHSEDCPVKITKRKARLEWSWKKPRLEAKRLAFHEDQELIELYKQRAGGEAVFSQLKNHMGMRRLRIRGFAKAKCTIILKAIALNIKKFCNWMLIPGSSTSKNQNTGMLHLVIVIFCPESSYKNFDISNMAA